MFLANDKHEGFFILLLLVGVLLSIFVTVFTARLTNNPRTANVRRAGASGLLCDLDGSGTVDDQDKGIFYNLYFNREEGADMNGDEVINVLDQELFENCF